MLLVVVVVGTLLLNYSLTLSDLDETLWEDTLGLKDQNDGVTRCDQLVTRCDQVIKS